MPITRPLVFLCVLCVSAVNMSFAGDLNPPAGPITPTPGPEPRIPINAVNTPGDANALFNITQPGSYYLNGNVTGVAGKHGIEISASGVTIDLNGFDLAGVESVSTLDGITCRTNFVTNIAIVNGSIRNWAGDGIDIGTIGADGCRLFGVLSSDNLGIGILAGNRSAILNFSAYNNADNGIEAGIDSTLTNCAAASNAGYGIITRDGCVIIACAAGNNNGGGISARTGSTVIDCTARANTLDGINCISRCIIRGNTCALNGFVGNGAGIRVTGADNRIEANHCTAADRGIEIDVAGNIIVRNTCAANTLNWDIAADNYFGPIINRTGVLTPAVSGDSAADTSGSTHPNANFTY